MDKRPRAPRLVGREEAWRALDAALHRAARFEAPQLVTVLAAPGMGKSRLLAEWVAAIERRGEHRVVRAEVEGTGELGLVAELLRRRFDVDERVDAEGALAAFRAELQVVFGDRRVTEVAGLLGRFLGFALPPSPLGQALSLRPDQETEVARAVLCRFLEQDSRTRPLLLVIDDLHLADDASLELLARLGGELGEAPVVVVMAARSELLLRRPEWGRGCGSHARVELGPLSPLELDVFIRSALATGAVASALVDRAALESGGNPGLLEQLLAFYLQRGILVADRGAPVAFDAERAAEEPPALGPEAAALARVAALAAGERDLLARGLAMGPVFWTGGVVALGRLGAEVGDPRSLFAAEPGDELEGAGGGALRPRVEVQHALASLAERDYLVRLPSTVPGEDEWSFAQSAERALIAAGADPELMRRRRRFAAQWLQARLPPSSERLEVLGDLYQGGDDSRRAGLCFLDAADEARRQLRYERARALYLRGLELLAVAVDDCGRALDAYHSLGDVAARLGRTREALAHFGEMLAVAWRLDLPGKAGAAHARIGRLHRALGDYPRALEHLRLAQELFEVAGDRPGVAATLDDIGRVLFLTGDSESSMGCHRAALSLREALRDEQGKALTLSWMGLVDLQGGQLARAQQSFRRALRISQAARDAHGIVFSVIDLAAVEREAGHPDRARALLEEARRMVRDRGERLYECHLALQIGGCLLAAGEVEAAERELTEAREVARQYSARRLVAAAERGLSEVGLARGDNLAARDHARAALELAEAIGAAPLAGAALRLLATAVTRGAPGESERGGPREMFDRAVELLGDAGAELELGRTFDAYAEFEQGTGRAAAAAELRTQARGIQQRAVEGVDRGATV
jgi:tetratricopeptide (TPR) repeat protein